MKDIFVCVGSACHLKGSYDVIEQVKAWIEENELKDEFTVKASFCLGQCTRAVSVRIDNEIHSLTPQNAKDFLNKQLCRR